MWLVAGPAFALDVVPVHPDGYPMARAAAASADELADFAHVVLAELWGPAGTRWASEGAATLLNGAYDVPTVARDAGLEDVDLVECVRRFDGSDRAYLCAAVVVAWIHAELGRDELRTFWSSATPPDGILVDRVHDWLVSQPARPLPPGMRVARRSR